MKISTKKLRNTGKKTLTFECVECGAIEKTDKYEEILKGENMTTCLSCGATMLNVGYGFSTKSNPIQIIWFAWQPDFEGF